MKSLGGVGDWAGEQGEAITESIKASGIFVYVTR